MMGREKRAQLLLPSFVFVAGAAVSGCEGRSSTWIVNPPFQTGGYPGSGYGSAGLGSGGYGNGSSVTNPPEVGQCPVNIPTSGAACLSSAQGGPEECDYGTRERCAATLAWCTDGVWQLVGYATDCVESGGGAGAGAGAPPIVQAGSAGQAPIAGGGSAGALPSAEGGTAGEAPIAEGGTAGEGPAPPPVVYCPQTLPTADAACYKPSSLTSYRCDYATACGAYEATCNGQWQLAFHPSPTDSCVGGAPGN